MRFEQGHLLYSWEETMHRLVLASLFLVVLAASSLGQAPDILWHYHLLPRFSYVREMGGFAGFDNLYRARGDFDFVRQWDGDGTFSASFDDAEIWGSLISDGPVIAIVLDVDRVFNLETLRGELLPTMNPFADVYQFKGEAPDSSFVNLYAYQRGPWLYLRGNTNPPPDTADFIEYDIRALARTRPWADMNGDNRIDMADYTHLRDRLGSDMGGLTFADWKQQFGEQLPDIDGMEAEMLAAIGGGAFSTLAIPEPTSLVLAAFTGALLAVAKRMRVPR